MGKGDKKTRRGKIANNSYGARRPRKTKKPMMPAKKSTKPKAKTSTKKSTAKKTAKKD